MQANNQAKTAGKIIKFPIFDKKNIYKKSQSTTNIPKLTINPKPVSNAGSCRQRQEKGSKKAEL
jgi:hypothetical protein